jgi:hypothetical protein
VEIRREQIQDALNFLHRHQHLPSPRPTSNDGPYLLPLHLRQQVLDRQFSQDSLQLVSDHIGYFLGLLESIRVTIGLESSDYMLVRPGEIGHADKVGLYKVSGSTRREIQLTKKFRFQLQHVLAILAHETVHNYLMYWQIGKSDELENEILTDVAAAYLGLGSLLLDGYSPIEWTTDHWTTSSSSGYTTHSIVIGYVSREGIRFAMGEAAVMRRMNEIADGLPLVDRLEIRIRLWGRRRRHEKNKRKARSLEGQIRENRSLYDKCARRILGSAKHVTTRPIPEKVGRQLIKIANTVALGKAERVFERLSKRARHLIEAEEIRESELDELAARVARLRREMARWAAVTENHLR